MTRAIFNSAGKIPYPKDKFIMWVSGVIKLEWVAFTTFAEIASQQLLLSFKHLIMDLISFSTAGAITILSRTRSTMYVVGDLLLSGILLARFGPIFIKYLLKPLAILVLSLVICPLTRNLEQVFEAFFLLITSFRIHNFFSNYIYFHSKEIHNVFSQLQLRFYLGCSYISYIPSHPHDFQIFHKAYIAYFSLW